MNGACALERNSAKAVTIGWAKWRLGMGAAVRHGPQMNFCSDLAGSVLNAAVSDSLNVAISPAFPRFLIAIFVRPPEGFDALMCALIHIHVMSTLPTEVGA